MLESEIPQEKLVEKIKFQRNKLTFLENSLRTYKKTIEQMNMILDAVTEGVIGFDINMRLSIFNKQFLLMWGLKEEEVDISDEMELFDIISKKLVDSEGFAEMIDNLKNLKEKELYGILNLKNGKIYEFQTNPSNSWDDLAGRIWIFKDITEYVNSEMKMLAYTQELENQKLNLELQIEELQKLIPNNSADRA